jgi:hypothetical protein
MTAPQWTTAQKQAAGARSGMERGGTYRCHPTSAHCHGWLEHTWYRAEALGQTGRVRLCDRSCVEGRIHRGLRPAGEIAVSRATLSPAPLPQAALYSLMPHSICVRCCCKYVPEQPHYRMFLRMHFPMSLSKENLVYHPTKKTMSRCWQLNSSIYQSLQTNS